MREKGRDMSVLWEGAMSRPGIVCVPVCAQEGNCAWCTWTVHVCGGDRGVQVSGACWWASERGDRTCDEWVLVQGWVGRMVYENMRCVCRVLECAYSVHGHWVCVDDSAVLSLFRE